jgi:hypothetical protein
VPIDLGVISLPAARGAYSFIRDILPFHLLSADAALDSIGKGTVLR